MTLAADPGSVVAFGPLMLAIPVALVAGLVSFLSPCCLPLLPGYLAYVTGSAGADSNARSRTDTVTKADGDSPSGTAVVSQTPPGAGRTISGTLLFVLGFAAVFTSYGAAFGMAGAVLIAHQEAVTRILGVVTIVLGLMFAGVLERVSLAGRTLRLAYRPKVGLTGAPLLGVLFGVGWTPCIGPTLAAVLALSATTGGAGRGAILSFAYSVGLGLPFLLAAFGIQRAFKVFSFARRHAPTVMRVGGLMLVTVGLLEVSGLWLDLMAQLKVYISTWQPPI